jgi:hypothetical protein
MEEANRMALSGQKLRLTLGPPHLILDPKSKLSPEDSQVLDYLLLDLVRDVHHDRGIEYKYLAPKVATL